MKTAQAPAYRVLVADDDNEVRSALSGLLREEGFGLLEANNARTALEVMSREHPDVVLLDLQTSGTGAMEVLAESRKFNGDIPVIVIAGSATADSAAQAVRKGAYAYLTKPLEPAELVLTVRRALERRGGKRASRPALAEVWT